MVNKKRGSVLTEFPVYSEFQKYLSKNILSAIVECVRKGVIAQVNHHRLFIFSLGSGACSESLTLSASGASPLGGRKADPSILII